MSDKSKPAFDAEKFAEELRAARDASKPTEAEEQAHLSRLELFTTLLGLSGVLLASRGVISPLAMLAIGYYKYAKFAILAHHSLHGGWGLTRRGWYAQGAYRRLVDWLDWIFPQAWIVEHNKCHHYRLNEHDDPDYVQRNLDFLRRQTWPLAGKYAFVVYNAMTWKWFYYASNTLKLLHASKTNAPEHLDGVMMTVTTALGGALKGDSWYMSLTADLLLRVLGPPAVLYMLLLPMAAGSLQWLLGASVGTLGGLPFCWAAFVTVLGAEIVTNLHAFITIVTNHAGSDLWGFEGGCNTDSAEFYLRAVLGSAAYHAGTNAIDYFHGYLNYQGEHHAFPNLSPLHYQRLHPHFKRVCAKHGVPYVQEAVWTRTRKTVDIMCGTTSQPLIKGEACKQPELWAVPKSD
eukprot:TRINITY_DN16781_c0_g1_i1.p1 TRINITY_DN16781_c0_g1~~TRINITY_DN16781_c0_g1_i1.p1  ORF type:complete len:404 (-),score=78.96 TRINITY_DN16781_c0_g1_i1:57-1268(-)